MSRRRRLEGFRFATFLTRPPADGTKYHTTSRPPDSAAALTMLDDDNVASHDKPDHYWPGASSRPSTHSANRQHHNKRKTNLMSSEMFQAVGEGSYDPDTNQLRIHPIPVVGEPTIQRDLASGLVGMHHSKALAFGVLADLVHGHVIRHRSDLFHDALFLDKAIEKGRVDDYVFYYAVRDSGTAIADADIDDDELRSIIQMNAATMQFTISMTGKHSDRCVMVGRPVTLEA